MIGATPAEFSETFLNKIVLIYQDRGGDHYGEAVTQLEHALQCAYVAKEDGAGPDLIVAALLHDIGHLLHKRGEDAADRGIDTCHERIGAGFLALGFPKAVSEPVALHVKAKRYLATMDITYLTGLSPASLQSFYLQGGIMTDEEIKAFQAEPYAEDALRLRRYDEMGKVMGVTMPDFASYVPMMRHCLSPVKVANLQES